MTGPIVVPSLGADAVLGFHERRTQFDLVPDIAATRGRLRRRVRCEQRGPSE